MAELSPHNPAEVRKQSLVQYENVWNGYADARRALYPYEVTPGEERPAYNIWEDMADNLNPEQASLIYELGTNDGYFHSILRHKGFKGRFVGIDIEGGDLPAVEYIARQQFPGAEVNFVQGDAQNLKGLIEDSSAPIVVAGFLPYHVPKPREVFSEMHRILEPGGTGEVSSRDVSNQLDTWETARLVAHSHSFAFPQEVDKSGRFVSKVPIERISVYSHFNISQTRQLLNSSKKFKILKEHVQDRDLWIPDTETGFYDYSRVIESLLAYTVSLRTGERPDEAESELMSNFINTHIREMFSVAARRDQQEWGLPTPHKRSHATQAFFKFQALK